MSVIYETINLYNKQNNISPWRYIGSDQHNNPNYLGSNQALKIDIKRFGVKNFVKVILEDCGDIENKELRKIESEKYLKPHNVRKDPSYYNKTDHYGPGRGKLGMKHKVIRSEEHRKKISEHRTGSTKSVESRILMRDRKLGSKAKIETKEKMSLQRSGEKNINALYWTIITPDGDVFNVTGLRKWVKDNKYNYHAIYNSKYGWTSIKHGVGKGGGRKKKEKTSGN